VQNSRTRSCNLGLQFGGLKRRRGIANMCFRVFWRCSCFCVVGSMGVIVVRFIGVVDLIFVVLVGVAGVVCIVCAISLFGAVRVFAFLELLVCFMVVLLVFIVGVVGDCYVVGVVAVRQRLEPKAMSHMLAHLSRKLIKNNVVAFDR